MHLAPDTFLLRGQSEGTFVLYAPLLGVAAHVNASMARLVERLRVDPHAAPRPDETAALATLRRLGIVSAEPYPDLRPRGDDESFVPTSVSLFLTSRCNLGCTYCYASANEAPRSMRWEVARDALDLLVRNCVQRRRPIGVTLHGGGEATLEWALLVKIVEHVEAAARRHDLQSHLSIGTNGVMPPERARWLAGHFAGATVSLDGPADVHDRQRPTVGGDPSFAIVGRTLRIFDEHHLPYGLRVTVTRDWVARLPEAVAAICAACAGHEIQVEPVFAVGRAERTAVGAPEAGEFVEAYRRAREVAVAAGRRLSYSGARAGTVTDRFCEAAGRSFAVTPDGDVSSCYEVTDAADPRNDVFVWGRHDASRDAFALDEGRRRAQRKLTVHGKPGCADCFCKWHCAGDCSAKLAHLGDATDTTKNPRCEVNRALTRDQILRALAGEPDLLARGAEEAPDASP